MSEVVASVLIVVGAGLNAVGSIGLLRFPDVFARMHAATKPATLGLACILLGAVLQVAHRPDVAKLLLVLVLQFLTAPVGAHMVGRAAYFSGAELNPDTSVDELSEARGTDGDTPRP